MQFIQRITRFSEGHLKELIGDDEIVWDGFENSGSPFCPPLNPDLIRVALVHCCYVCWGSTVWVLAINWAFDKLLRNFVSFVSRVVDLEKQIMYWLTKLTFQDRISKCAPFYFKIFLLNLFFKNLASIAKIWALFLVLLLTHFTLIAGPRNFPTIMYKMR